MSELSDTLLALVVAVAACVVVMEALRWLGCLNRCESVGRATSAEAGGPTDRVTLTRRELDALIDEAVRRDRSVR